MNGKGLLALLVLWGVACTPLGMSADVSYEQVKSSLEGRHWNPPQSAELFGEAEIPHLLAIIQDESLLNYYRFRALRVLENYPTDEVASFLENLLHPDAPALLLRHGLEVYATAFSSSRPESVQKLAWQFRDHADPELRLTVARALRPISPDKFERLLEQEHYEWVRQAALQ